MGGLLHLVYSEKGPGRAAAPRSPLLAVPNVTVHQSLYCYYDGPLLCGFSVAIKGLIAYYTTQRNAVT